VLPLLTKHSLSIGKGHSAVWLPYAHRIRISTPLYIIVSTQNPGPDFNVNFISWSRLLWHLLQDTTMPTHDTARD
jgi:hypothetical protein